MTEAAIAIDNGYNDEEFKVFFLTKVIAHEINHAAYQVAFEFFGKTKLNSFIYIDPFEVDPIKFLDYEERPHEKSAEHFGFQFAFFTADDMRDARRRQNNEIKDSTDTK
jgi:hypothetical protein